MAPPLTHCSSDDGDYLFTDAACSEPHAPPPQRITALKPSRRDPDRRVLVCVDRKAFATIPAEDADRLGLHIDAPASDELLRGVREAAEVDDAASKAVQRLRRHPMSRRRLETKLLRAGHGANAVAAALDRLERAGHLDDEALGRSLLEQWRTSTHAGPRLLYAKLMQRGLDASLAQRLVRETPTDTASQTEEATTLATKRAAAMAKLDARTRRRRLWGLLARRGYEGEVIEEALRRVDADRQGDGRSC